MPVVVVETEAAEAAEEAAAAVVYIRNMPNCILYLPKLIHRIHRNIFVVWYNHYIDIPLVIPAHTPEAAVVVAAAVVVVVEVPHWLHLW
jgi:hypothetical protein